MRDDLDRQLAGMLEAARAQAERMQQIQAEVAELSVRGEAGNGLVTATVRGTGQITNIGIDRDAVRYYDADALGAVVLEAVNDGIRRALTLARDRYREVLPDVTAFDTALSRVQPATTATVPDQPSDPFAW